MLRVTEVYCTVVLSVTAISCEVLGLGLIEIYCTEVKSYCNLLYRC